MKEMKPTCSFGIRGAAVAALALASVALRPTASTADVHVLSLGKVIQLQNRGDAAKNGGTVAVGGDRALQTLFDPRCPMTSGVEVEAYLQSTSRDAILADVELDCAKWAAKGKGFRYKDTMGTVRSISYTPAGLKMEIRGAGFTPVDGPVAFVQAQLQVGDQILRARAHNFSKNNASKVVSRKPSAAAAVGEAGFWDVMLGDDDSEEGQQQVIADLEKAAKGSKTDGRSRFLLAMLRMYRFGQRVLTFRDVSAEARAELTAANAAFAVAVPLLWDDASGVGDSRVPGFAAATKYLLGVVNSDAALEAEGFAELERAVEVNTFFNVFDFVTVLQVLPPSDALFQQVFAVITAYLNDPETLQCGMTQPEICGNAGFAPHALEGSLVLFGDLYAKAGNLQQAQFWYTLLNAIADTTWPFAAVIQDRTANAAARVALYKDSDPTNDPPLIGAGVEACAVCHRR